ncbi:uncharacterized protein involved in response to NO [Ruegeria marina]|uniref:Uncharacterized protein involved in response to NO n=2 Tax=Ruegeria marina TaxID=639004 RepID=A0A1G6YA42_9RHOB|nr:uncharacterized protein involved in response to NO [Ruegeria marina]
MGNVGLSHFWDAPYRPLFLAAALWALVSIAWWPLGVSLGLPKPGFTPLVLWHVHELIFGFFSVAIAGYVLTALPHWVCRPPEHGRILKVLVAFWVLSRLSMAMADRVPPLLLLSINSLFFVLLAALILYRTLSGRAFSKALFGVVVVMLGLADIIFLKVAKAGDVSGSLEIAHACLIGMALLVTVVGARLVPAFTESWRQHSGRSAGHAPASQLRAAAISAQILSLMAILMGWSDLAHAALVLSASLLCLVMARWQSLSTLANPLVAGLHFAFFWLPVGLALKGGLWLLSASYPLADAIHALTIGAISGLIMAISGRAACHGSGPQLQAIPSLSLAMALIWIATCLRLMAPLAAGYGTEVETAAATFWCAAWLSFLFGFRLALKEPTRRPVLSGKKPTPRDPERKRTA